MKKLLIFIFVFFTATVGFSQYAVRNMVVVEVATGTWCPNCPGAAMGVEDMLEHGDSVAVIENHNGDSYTTTDSDARNDMYNVSGVPSTVFDGMAGIVGGYPNQTMFPNFQPIYLTRKSSPSPVEIEMTETHTGLNYNVTVTLTKLNTISASNLRLIFAITESHIPKSWMGQTEVNFVNRKMVPDAGGTPVSFASGNVQTVNLSFSLGASWKPENCEFVAFLQNMDSGQGDIPGTNNPPYGSLHKYQVYQGIKYAVTPLTADFSADMTQVSTNFPVQFSSEVEGGFMFVPITYDWSFPGATPDHSTDPNPIVTYTECGKHDVTLVVNAGGLINTITKTEYISVAPYLDIVSIPADTVCTPQTITLNGTIPNGQSYLWEPGGQTTAMITLDPQSVGLGAHTYSLTATDMDGCSNNDTITVVFEDCTGIPVHNAISDISIFPNPNHGSFVLQFVSDRNEPADITISDPYGRVVYSDKHRTNTGQNSKEIRLNDQAAGVYCVSVRSDKQNLSRKFIIQ